MKISFFTTLLAGAVATLAAHANPAPTIVPTFEISGVVVPAVFTSDGGTVVAQGHPGDSAFRLFDLESGQPGPVLKIPTTTAFQVSILQAVSKDRETGLFASLGRTNPFVFNFRTFQKVTLKSSGAWTPKAIFLDSASLVASISYPANSAYPRTLILWDPQTGNALQTIPTGLSSIADLTTPSPDCSCLALIGELNGKSELQIWNLDSFRLSRRYSLSISRPDKVKFSKDGRRMVVGAADTIHVYDVATGTVNFKIPQATNDFAISKNSKFLVVVPQSSNVNSPGSTIKILNLNTGELVFDIVGKAATAAGDALVSPNGEWVVSRAEPHPRLRIWDLRSLIK